jgi:hypothetical protein
MKGENPVITDIKCKFWSFLVSQFRKNRHKYKILLVLSHMRSGSTLLINLLNTNKEISGYGETHIKYSSEDDFDRLYLAILKEVLKFRLPKKYLADKILHSHLIADDSILNLPNIRIIFLIREPNEALASIARMKGKHYDLKFAEKHYTERLLKLQEYAMKIKNTEKCLFLTYDQIIDNTDSVFKVLKRFLDVKHDFSESYNVASANERLGVGDHSDIIKAGRIIRNVQRKPITLSAKIKQKTKKIFQGCKKTFGKYCTVIGNI